MAKFTHFFQKNIYITTGILFTVWILFFDAADTITQLRLKMKIRKIKQEIKHYQEELNKIKDTEEMLKNNFMLEKFAREHYFMKRPGEDIYIIE